MSGQGFGWGGRGGGWALAGYWGSDVPMKELGQRSLAEASVENTDLLHFLNPSRALSSVPSLESHHRPKRTYKVSGTGWEAEAYGLLRLLLRGRKRRKTITEEHLPIC